MRMLGHSEGSGPRRAMGWQPQGSSWNCCSSLPRGFVLGASSRLPEGMGSEPSTGTRFILSEAGDAQGKGTARVEVAPCGPAPCLASLINRLPLPVRTGGGDGGEATLSLPQ